MMSDAPDRTVEPSVPTSRASRLAAQRRAAAARSRAYRERLRERREPSTAAVDAAIVEALSYWLLRWTTPPEPEDIMHVAVLCLERQGYRYRHSAEAIARRLAPRHEHRDVGYVPSVMTTDPATVMVPKNGRWSPSNEVIVAILTRRYKRPPATV